MIDSECFLLVAKFKKNGVHILMVESDHFTKKKPALQCNVSAQDSKAGEGCFESRPFMFMNKFPAFRWEKCG
jgi:hypothetical protein